MTKTVPVPEEYKNKLDRFEYLLSRTCANIEFFLMKHKGEPAYVEDPLFERLFSEAVTAAIDYSEMLYLTKEKLGNGNSLSYARTVFKLDNDNRGTHRGTNNYLVIEEVK